MSWTKPKTWTKPTLTEVVDGYAALVKDAARNEQLARVSVDTLPPGDDRLKQAQLDLMRYPHEQRHWREYLNFYRALLLRYPEHAHKPSEHALAVSRGAKPSPPAVVVPLHSVPREPGADDRDELPF